ncbi:hypothetical protein AB0M54_47450 [Actinoplanes sp. NPDC051470]|uniref:hypothetical protein n=1 Tax=unclassified Actinoplanes TaxID=2626549 RepID=UPI0034435700
MVVYALTQPVDDFDALSDIEIPGLASVIAHTAQAILRPIGGWTHPTSHDIPALPVPGTTREYTRPGADPPF